MKLTPNRVFLFLTVLHCQPVLAENCPSGVYFSPQDHDHARPLRRPPPELSSLLQAAQAGDALAQRNLASNYAVGYMLPRCAARSAYWYEMAANGGDTAARDRVEGAERQAVWRGGRECSGAQCAFDTSRAVKLELSNGQHGRYATEIAIDDVEVPGFVDTRASDVRMGSKMASLLGIPYANGERSWVRRQGRKVALWSLELPAIRVGNAAQGGIRLENVPVVVVAGDAPVVVGQSVLARLEQAQVGQRLVLSKP